MSNKLMEFKGYSGQRSSPPLAMTTS